MSRPFGSSGRFNRQRWTADPGSELAHLRVQAHNNIDVRWKYGSMSRSGVYKWLAKGMNLPLECTHGERR